MSEVRPGELIAGRYRLIEELGGGGMGVAFLARDEREKRDVAVKILRLTGSDATRRLRREARAAERLDPTRVARVFEIGETTDGHPFIAMEYVAGRTLRALLGAGGAFERREAVRIVREIATTLGGAHGAGLIHRDVKPDNVMVQPDGRVVLLDFGIVKDLEQSDDAAQATTQLTADGTMIGTPAYLAPEQALGRLITPAVDQFALGVTAFELLTGRLPWTATDLARILAQLLADTPTRASTLNGSLPEGFDAVLARALAKSPEARFPSVTAFASALEAAERGEMLPLPASQGAEWAARTVAVDRDGPLEGLARGPRRARWAAAFVVTLTVAGGGAALLRGRRRVVAAPASAPAVPAALVVTKQAPLACPIFEVDGLPELKSRLGAAAASLACVRTKWYLGGSDEKVLVPAALLDVPVEPRENFVDPFASEGVRERTLNVAATRGLPSLDGVIARRGDGWSVDLVVRDPAGAAVARVASVEAPYLEPAIRRAVTLLWHTAPLVPQTIDADVARWTAYPDIETGLLELDKRQTGAVADVCARIHERGAALGSAYYVLSNNCGGDTDVDAGATALDESSGAALVTSFAALWARASTNPFSEAEMNRIAAEADAMRASETSRFGRASLSWLAGLLRSELHESAEALAAALASVGVDPLFFESWFNLVWYAWHQGASGATTALASAWCPQEPEFLGSEATTQTGALEARLRDSQLAYILEPKESRTLLLGRALAEAGRSDEVYALARATPIDLSAPDAGISAVLLASVDLHDAKFARAISRLETAGSTGTFLLPRLAGVLGLMDETASKWGAAFVAARDDEAARLAASPAAVPLCMSAGRPLATRCLSRLEKVEEPSSWGAGGDLFLEGAKRFAAGDVRGAVGAWRPIVAGPNESLAVLLPTSAFERAGEPDLAARIDARKMAYRVFAGVSDAAPREAHRAFDRGDRARAKELASSVIRAWADADAPLPAVADMRALLARLGD